MVKIGRDYFVELSQDEALQYIGKKEKVLSQRSERLTEQAAQIKAHIAFVSHSAINLSLGNRGK
jgi:prefoldin subunit 5